MFQVAVIERAALDNGHRGQGAGHKGCVIIFAVYRRTAPATTRFGTPWRCHHVSDRREGGEAVEPALRSMRDLNGDLGAAEVL